MLNIHLISLFPEAIDSYINHSVLGRALASGKIKVHKYNIRDFSKDRLKRVDDKPYGGGPGMVIQAEPVLRAVKKAMGRKNKDNIEIIFFSPHGKKWTNAEAKKLSEKKHIILIAGHYEGIDARVIEALDAKEYSIGDYITSGGELPALVLIDTIARQVPGVLGNMESIEENRLASPYVYTRPRIITWNKKKYAVPDVLLSGNHKEIEKWKRKKLKKDNKDCG